MNSKTFFGDGYDFDVTDCRSARRSFFPQAFDDTPIGFRVVLVAGAPQA